MDVQEFCPGNIAGKVMVLGEVGTCDTGDEFIIC